MKYLKIISIVLIISMLIMVNMSWGMIYAGEFRAYNTIDIINVSDKSDIYVLVKSKEVDKEIENVVKEVDRHTVYIEKAYNNNRYPRALKNTKENIIINGKKYLRIKVVKDVKIAWYSDNMLIAKIKDNEIRIINLENLNKARVMHHYIMDVDTQFAGSIYPKTYGRKAAIYDASSDKLEDIGEERVKEEKSSVENSFLLRVKISSIISDIEYILSILLLVLLIVVVLIVDHKRAKKKKNKEV